MGTTSLAVFWPKGRTGSWLLVAAVGIAAQFILWSISEPADLFSDFYKAYFPAADRLWTEGAVATWETTESAAVGFVNLPILAWAFVPLALLAEPAAGWTFLAVGIAAIAVTFVLLLRLGDFNGPIAATLALSILANGPLVNSLREGNTTHLVLLLLVVALLLWRAGFEYAAGAVLGLCALIKLPLMLFGLYALLRGRWRMVAGGATTISGALLLSLAVFGIEINIDWYRNCIAPFVGGVMPAFNVQSIDGFLVRLETGPAQLMEWTPRAPSLWHRIVRTVVLSAVLILAFGAMVRGGNQSAAGKRSSERNILEFSIVLVLAVVTSPVSWSHYYLLLLLPWALYLGGTLNLPDDATTRSLMAGGMALASLPVIILPFGSGLFAEIASRALVSAWLFGGLMMLAALIRGLRAHVPATDPTQRTVAP